MLADAPCIELGIPTHLASFGHEARLRLDPQSGVPNLIDQQLLEVIARGFAARDQLLAMSESDVTAMPKTQLRHLQRIAGLAYLEPAIVRSVINGTQPGHLSARSLWRQDALPLSWTEQRQLLRFKAG